MNMSNKTYDILKWIAMYLLPAAGTLYFALAGIWSLPYGEQVVTGWNLGSPVWRAGSWNHHCG